MRKQMHREIAPAWDEEQEYGSKIDLGNRATVRILN